MSTPHTSVEQLQELANALAPEIERHLPEDVSFSLFLYNCETRDGQPPAPEHNHLYYISGARRAPVVQIIKEWLDQQIFFGRKHR